MRRRVLIDECVHSLWRRALEPHCDAVNATYLGWRSIPDNELLQRARSGGFELLLTADRNLPYQQNLSVAGLGVVVLPFDRWESDLVEHWLDAVLTAIERVSAGEAIVVEKPEGDHTPQL